MTKSLFRLITLLLLFTTLFFSCQPDALELASLDMSGERLQTTERSFSDLDFLPVNAIPSAQSSARDGNPGKDRFFQTLNQIDQEGRVGPEFKQSYGYPIWTYAEEHAIAETDGYLTLAPSARLQDEFITGIWFHYFDDQMERVHFMDVNDLFDRIAQSDGVAPYNHPNFWMEAVSTTHFDDVVFNHLRSEPLNTILNAIGGERDDEVIEEPCEGGGWWEMCATIFTGDGFALSVSSHYQNLADWAYIAYDASAFSKLPNPDTPEGQQIIETKHWGYIDEYVAYYEFREGLAAIGIGNGPTGILTGSNETFWSGAIIHDMERKCELVWIACWEPPADFDITGSGGGGGVYEEPYIVYEDITAMNQYCDFISNYEAGNLYDIDPVDLANSLAQITTGIENFCSDYGSIFCDNLFTLHETQRLIHQIQNGDAAAVAEVSAFIEENGCMLSEAEKECVLEYLDVSEEIEFGLKKFQQYLCTFMAEYELDMDDLNVAGLENIQSALESGTHPMEELHYIIWALQNFGNTFNHYSNSLNEFGDGDDPPFVPDANTGIEILSSHVPSIPPTIFPIFVETPYREGHEYDPENGIIPQDLQFGTNGNTDLLSDFGPNSDGNQVLLGLSDNQLLDLFGDLLHDYHLNEDLQGVATDYLNRVINGTGGDYYSPGLSNYVLNNDHTQATVRDFGRYLNNGLKLTGGDIESLGPKFFDEFGVQFRAIYSTGERSSGLKILVNDTEKLIIYDIGDYSFDPSTNEWSATFYFQILDNFGLDDQDLIDFQFKKFRNYGEKFAAWWILQHVRGYKPFRTDIRAIFKIKGDLDNE